MLYRHTLFSVLAVCTTLLIFSSQQAHAGLEGGSPFNGVFNSDGSGYCSGNMNGFHDSSDSSNYIALEEYTSSSYPSGYVACRYNGNYKFATVSTGDTALFEMLKQAVTLSRETYVYFHWNSSGNVLEQQRQCRCHANLQRQLLSLKIPGNCDTRRRQKSASGVAAMG
jgi:hypothetical protein